MDLRGTKVIVTGGAGFIGSHVVDRLTSSDVRVTVLDDLSTGHRENLAEAAQQGVVLRVGDICDAAFVARELAGAEAVIHMASGNLRASLRDPRRAHEQTATGSLVVELAAVRAGVGHFVYVSSAEAYGSAIVEPMSEDHPLLPTTVYGAGKAAGELYALACMRSCGLPVTVVRLFNSYGPRAHTSGDSAEVIPKFVSRLRAGLPPVIFGDGTQTRDFTWVQETAAGIVAATQSDALVGEAVNIAHGTPVSIARICRLLIEIMESELAPEFAEGRPGDVVRHWAETAKAKARLGFEASTPIDVGLRRYVAGVLAGMETVEEHEPEVVRNW